MILHLKTTSGAYFVAAHDTSIDLLQQAPNLDLACRLTVRSGQRSDMPLPCSAITIGPLKPLNIPTSIASGSHTATDGPHAPPPMFTGTVTSNDPVTISEPVIFHLPHQSGDDTCPYCHRARNQSSDRPCPHCDRH